MSLHSYKSLYCIVDFICLNKVFFFIIEKKTCLARLAIKKKKRQNKTNTGYGQSFYANFLFGFDEANFVTTKN